MKLRYFVAETVTVESRKQKMIEVSLLGKTRTFALRDLFAWGVVLSASWIAGSCFGAWFAGKQVEPWLCIGLCLAVFIAVTPEST